MTKRTLALVAATAGLLVPLLVTAPATAGACTTPSYSTPDQYGMVDSGRYVVANDMWNVSGYDVSQRLTVCSYRSWNVTAQADDSKGDGAVKTYPNVHRDFINWSNHAQPSLRGFSVIRTSFASSAPEQGVYDAAYDIWLNDFKREVMVWTHNRGQRPGGHPVAHVHLSGHRWTVWAEPGNGYIAFVPGSGFDAGSVNLRAMLRWLVRHHRVPASAKLAQIGFGFEVVASGGSPSTFSVSDFSIRTRR